MRVLTHRLGRVLLSAALLAAALTVRAAQAAAQTVRQVAVTFDDLPTPYGELEDMRRITSRLLESVRRNGVPAVGFVNERKLYRRG